MFERGERQRLSAGDPGQAGAEALDQLPETAAGQAVPNVGGRLDALRLVYAGQVECEVDAAAIGESQLDRDAAQDLV